MKSSSSMPAEALSPAGSADSDAGSTNTSRRAAVVVAALAGAAAATTALAVPADAATGGAVWNRVANCESSQNWHINTGNGYYGGVQFSSSTWGAYGGHKYAGQADNATRLEQIAVARRVLASQGPNAWPVCGPRGGLTRSTGHATSASLPAHPGGGASGGASSSKHAHHGHTVRVAAHQSHAGHAAHKAKHRHASKAHAPASHHHAKHASYTVRSGDTLSAIAHRKHVHGGWHALYKANRSTLSNPNVIHVGQVLHLP